MLSGLLDALGVMDLIAPPPDYSTLLVDAAERGCSDARLAALLEHAPLDAAVAWHHAAIRDDWKMVKQFALSGLAGADAIDARGRMPLHSAGAASAALAAESLIAAGAALDALDFEGRRPAELCVSGSACHSVIRSAERALLPPGAPRFARGDAVRYTASEGALLAASIVKVHLDDAEPYYTIAMRGPRAETGAAAAAAAAAEGGCDRGACVARERQTIGSRLLEVERPRAPAGDGGSASTFQ